MRSAKSNAHFFHFLTKRFEIYTICRRLPELQTDANVGMMKIVVCETEACKLFWPGTSTPR